ncbi:hypothetical protein Tco_0743147, partial [Tanacetum coccineum]
VPMPESSQQHIKIERICFDCGNLLHGLNCLECDLTRKILEKAFQKFQNTSKSSNDNSNVRIEEIRIKFIEEEEEGCGGWWLRWWVAAVVVRARVRCVVGDGECGGCGYVVGVDNRRITLIVIRARANSAVVVSLMEFVLVVLMEMKIKSIFQLRTLLINLQFIYPEPDYSLDFNSPQDLHNLQQQNLCCENCRGPHATIECQPMSQNSHSFGFDQFQPPQYTVYHQILNSQNEFFNSQNEQFNSGCEHLKTQITTLHDLIAQAMQKKEEEKRIAEEQAAKERYWKIPICDDDDDYDYTIA